MKVPITSDFSQSPSASVTTEEVRNYWEKNPLFSLAIKDGYGEDEFFKELERIKLEDDEVYTLDFWGFDQWANKKVLDVGCGPGWFTMMYARGGAEVTGVDITERAVEVARRYLEIRDLKNGKVRTADAQSLPFPDNSFDLVASCGVFHHVPDPMACLREVKRVLKPGGEARLALYYKNLLIRNRLAFQLMRWALRILGVRHYDVNTGVDPKTPEDFVRMYDGKNNPLGIAKTDGQWRAMIHEAGIEVLESRIHFFPLRFLRGNRFFNIFRKFFDSCFGFMVYYQLKTLS